MTHDYFTIGRFQAFSAAQDFARGEAAKRQCVCLVRRAGTRAFEVFVRQALPISEILKLAVRSGVVAAGSTLSALRAACLAMGLSPAGWRFLCRHGVGACSAALQPTLKPAGQFRNAVRLVEWQLRGGLLTPLPEVLAEHFVIAMGLILAEEPGIDARLAKAGAEEWSRLESSGRSKFAEQDWVNVLVWMRDHTPELDKNQWRTGWAAIARRYEAWLGESSHTAQWQSAVGDVALGRWRISPLVSASMLALEAIRMQHCVASYSDRCLAGDYRVFSVSSIETGKPLATIGIEKNEGGWELDQVKGKCNQKAPEDLAALADAVARMYRSSERITV